VMALVSEQVLVGAANGDKISCSGPSLMLDPQTAVHLALVLHELATNARKYGSLSVPSGRLSVTWEMRSNGGCRLLLSWLHGKRILVMEDEPLVSMELEGELAAAGCEVIGPAATLAHAKTLVEEGKYDAALVDVNLKGQPVDELAALLTEKNHPFAFVTGYGRDALPEAFRGAA